MGTDLHIKVRTQTTTSVATKNRPETHVTGTVTARLTVAMVTKVADKLRSGKAASSDNIYNDLLKNLPTKTL
jgi:hypothetical protein